MNYLGSDLILEVSVGHLRRGAVSLKTRKLV
jgi:hypothetical protein